jgi:hypothetical protein
MVLLPTAGATIIGVEANIQPGMDVGWITRGLACVFFWVDSLVDSWVDSLVDSQVVYRNGLQERALTFRKVCPGAACHTRLMELTCSPSPHA